MTPREKQLVRETFAQIEPIAEHVAALFYARLFEMAPHYRALFRTDMKEQGMKLMQTISVAVAHLDKLHEIVPVVQKLGQRHVDYGVQPEDYATVGAALLWTLRHGLGDDFTPEVEQAWTAVYGLLSETMKQAYAAAAPAVGHQSVAADSNPRQRQHIQNSAAVAPIRPR